MSISWNGIFLILIPMLIVFEPYPSFGNNSDMMTTEYTLNCQGSYYNISYQISNATVTGMPTNSNEGLIMSIQNSSNGVITVSFPRQYMDERVGETDNRFMVLIDNHSILDNNITDQSNSTHRILTINLPSGNFELAIPMGDTPESLAEHHKNCVVVPEFGSLAIMIISISVIGIILIQKRFQF